MAFARGARRQSAVIDDVDADLDVDVESAGVDAEDLRGVTYDAAGRVLTVTAPEAEKLIAYTRSKGVRLMDGFMWPHHPRTHKLRKLIDAGTIGEVKKVNAAFTFNMVGLPTTNIRMQPEAGGGGLLDVGCYTTYAIRWWMGAEPVKVWATVNGWPMNFSILRARATVCLSSSDSSSMPRIAMMSCSSL